MKIVEFLILILKNKYTYHKYKKYKVCSQIVTNFINYILYHSILIVQMYSVSVFKTILNKGLKL